MECPKSDKPRGSGLMLLSVLGTLVFLLFEEILRAAVDHNYDAIMAMIQQHIH